MPLPQWGLTRFVLECVTGRREIRVGDLPLPPNRHSGIALRPRRSLRGRLVAAQDAVRFSIIVSHQFPYIGALLAASLSKVSHMLSPPMSRSGTKYADTPGSRSW